MDNKKLYKTRPINFIDGIPVFSGNDFYIDNYDRISQDHLSYFKKTGLNPFMDENHYYEIEKSTEVIVRRYMSSESVKLKILDVGVGMGRLLENFLSAERYGMDISLGYLRLAKSKGIEVCMSKIEDMPYRDQIFDIVVCTDVLEHVLDLNLAIKKILEPLKDGGYLIIRVPYREDLSNYLSENYPYDLVHLRNFDESSLLILFQKIFGLEVVEHSYAGYQRGSLRFFSDYNFLNRMARKILGYIKILNKTSFIFITRKLCQPAEINIVVRKSKRQETA